VNIEFLSTVAVIAPDPAQSRRLYVDALGLPLEGQGNGYQHSEQIDGCKSFGDLAAVSGRRSMLWHLPVAGRASHATGQH